MRRNVRTEPHFEPAPDLPLFLPWFDFLGLEAGIGEEVGGGEIIPSRIAANIGEMEANQGIFGGHAIAHGAGSGPPFKHTPGTRLDRDFGIAIITDPDAALLGPQPRVGTVRRSDGPPVGT